MAIAPQFAPLEKATLAITHAGLNTALEALARGVPMVAIPITNDQPGVAGRLEWLGLAEPGAIRTDFYGRSREQAPRPADGSYGASAGNDRGIAAFTAAWNRPEASSRVYAASGSWVAFRGGHEFPTMVRKFEAKPIRAFLTTATNDMENCAGDWFLLDQEMEKALKFSGYDYRFRTIDGRHGAGYAEHWPEAMAFLWRGWPERVAAGPSAPRAQEILLPGEGWELVADGFKGTRGPACNAAGEIFFADTSNNSIHRIGLDGALYVTTNGDGPNASGAVVLVRDGRTRRVDAGIKFATGMAYRPDQWLLSVAEGHSRWIDSHQIGDDGTLSNKARFFHLHVADWDDDAGAECICYSLEGRQFVATRSGVQISADDGPTQVILPVPDRSRVIGVAIGGADKDVLFALCGTKIWKRKIRQHGMGAFSPWTKVTPNKL